MMLKKRRRLYLHNLIERAGSSGKNSLSVSEIDAELQDLIASLNNISDADVTVRTGVVDKITNLKRTRVKAVKSKNFERMERALS